MSSLMEPAGFDAETSLRMETPRGASVQVRLHWRRDDPFAVHAFIRERNSAVDWEFALSLLTDALAKSDEPIGYGDVRMQVTIDGELWLWLSSPDGCVVLTCEALEVAEFASVVQDLMVQRDPSATATERLDWFLTELRGGIEP